MKREIYNNGCQSIEIYNDMAFISNAYGGFIITSKLVGEYIVKRLTENFKQGCRLIDLIK